MYDESAAPWLPQQGWQRTIDAMHGGKMVKGWAAGPSGTVPLLIERKHRLWDPKWAPGVAFNPSIVVDGDTLRVILRVNGDGPQKCYIGCWTGDSLVDCAAWQISPHLASGLLRYGGQDCRLFMLDGVLHGLLYVGVDGGQGRQAIARFDGHTVTDAWRQPGSNLEKNWCPAVDSVDGKDRLRVLYSPEPPIVFSYDPVSHSVREDVDAAARRAGGEMRNSTQLIPYEDGWLTVVHIVHSDNGKKYAHRFVLLDRELTTVVKRSRQFFFNQPTIEYAAGLAFYNGRFIVSYGDMDREAWLAEVTPEVVAACLTGSPLPAVSVQQRPAQVAGHGGGGSFGNTYGYP
jgi:predicted GH43/DUF377 family glycosyl hydrolase